MLKIKALVSLALGLFLLSGCSEEQQQRVEQAARKAGEAAGDVAKVGQEVAADAARNVARSAKDAARSLDGRQLIAHCCYKGNYLLAHFPSVKFVTPSGHMPIERVLPDLSSQPHNDWIGLPSVDIDTRDATDGAIRAELGRYDANQNGLLEEPELAVLYLIELARGSGHAVTGLVQSDGAAAVRALHVSAEERRALGSAAQRELRGRMQPASRAIFGAIQELENHSNDDNR